MFSADDPAGAPDSTPPEPGSAPQPGTPEHPDEVRIVLRVGAARGPFFDPGLSAEQRYELLLRRMGMPAERARAIAAQPPTDPHPQPDDEPSDTGQPPTYHKTRWLPAGSLDIPVRRADDEILVDHFQFYLVDARGNDHWPQLGTTPIPFLETAHGVVKISSAATDHHAAVRLEAWTHEPPAPPEAWEAAREVTLPVASGTLALWQLMGGRSASDLAFTLGPPGRYRLRAHCRGRTAAQALGPATWRHEVEHYLLQFWPIDR
jgi:hypothetical protein